MQIFNTQLYVNYAVASAERGSSGENPFNSFMRAAQAIVGEEVAKSLGLTSKLSNVYGVLSPPIAFPSLPYSNLKDRSINMVELNNLFSCNQIASPTSKIVRKLRILTHKFRSSKQSTYENILLYFRNLHSFDI